MYGCLFSALPLLTLSHSTDKSILQKQKRNENTYLNGLELDKNCTRVSHKKAQTTLSPTQAQPQRHTVFALNSICNWFFE